MNLLTKLLLVGLPAAIGVSLFFLLRQPFFQQNQDAFVVALLGLLVGFLVSLIVRLVYEFHAIGEKLDQKNEMADTSKNEFYLSSSLAANVFESVSRTSVQSEVFVAFNNNIRRINQFDNKFLHYIFENKVSEANRGISDISRGFYQAKSEEEPVLNIKILEMNCCRHYMKAVDYGDPSYWCSEQGVRYLESILALSKSGVTVERVFISELPLDEQWKSVFEFHKKHKLNFCFVNADEIPASERVNFVIYDGEVLRDANLSIPSDGIGRPATFYFRNNENRHIFDEKNSLFLSLQARSSTPPI
jgi:hypothetical protein